jgi:hypothetical protein
MVVLVSGARILCQDMDSSVSTAEVEKLDQRSSIPGNGRKFMSLRQQIMSKIMLLVTVRTMPWKFQTPV